MLQAFREKDLAQQMIAREDYQKAKEHLQRAQKLFPEFENIDSMITVCDILIAATCSSQFQGCGIDYYWVLQTDPSSTSSDIKFRYEKLVKLLQPVRTSFQYTELALTFLQEALTVLTDEEKRSEYNLKRSTAGYLDTQLLSCGEVTNMGMITEGNLFSVSKSQQKSPFQDFYNFENDRKSENFEVGQIWSVNYRSNLHHNYRYARIDSNSKAATCVTWLKPIPVTSCEQRWCDIGLPVACGSFEVNTEMLMSIEVRWAMASSYKCCWAYGVTEEKYEIYPRKGEIWAVYKDWDLNDWSYNPNSVEGCKFEIVEIMSDFCKYLGANGVCLVKVNGFKSIFERQTIGGNPVTFHIPPKNLYIFSHNIPAYQFRGGELFKVSKGMFELDHLALPYYMIEETDAQKAQMALPNYFIEETDTEEAQNTSSFSDFPYMGNPSFMSSSQNEFLKSSRSANDFSAGQVWALYWGKDLMPRQYARINNAISENHVCVTFLEPLPFLDDEKEWMKHRIPITCGTFRVRERSVNVEMTLFSHLVECQESSDGSCYTILPQQGEFWAIYKDWNTNWKASDYETCTCLIVRILSDFSEGDVIVITKVREVKGCLSFFHTQQLDGFDLTYAVSRANILCFSHQIPAFRVPGISKYGIPESSWHLEPNALPSNFRTKEYLLSLSA